MAALFLAALTMGMIGSFHCIGMCGPLALSLPLANDHVGRFAGSLLYNLGRILTYSALGLLLGLAGKSFSVFGLQQFLSVFIGLVILVMLLVPKNWIKWSGPNLMIARYTTFVRKRIGRLFQQQHYGAVLAIGALNGLLPCGFVYMAVAGAAATADLMSSTLFMAAFGLGTLPVMWSFSFFGNYISLSIRQNIRRAYPVLIGVMACLLIVRGLGLGIPYISPSLNNQAQEVLECHPVVQR